MIQAHDLCPDDPLAPALLRAMDAAALRLAFAIARSDWRVAHARIERAKYKPGAKALLSVRVQLEGETAERLFALRILPPGRSSARYDRALRDGDDDKEKVLWLPPIEAVAWAFPYDHKIKHLPYLADPSLFEQFALPELLQVIAPEATVDAWSSEVAHYAAEQSCTMRVVLHLRMSDGTLAQRTLFGKCHAAGESGDAAAALRQINKQLTSAASPTFGVARLLFEQERFAIQWQEQAPGAPIEAGSLFAGSPQLFARLGAAVAALHATPVSIAPPGHGPDIDRLRRRLAVAASLPPQVGKTLAALLERLVRTSPRDPARAELRFAHGDLHPKNMFDDGARIHFIDLDAAHLAPPEHDVASFSAALIYHGALEGLGDEAIAGAVGRWQAAYEFGARAPLDQQRLAWLTAFCLLDERLYRCMTRLKPGRREIADRLLGWADAAAAPALGPLWRVQHA